MTSSFNTIEYAENMRIKKFSKMTHCKHLIKKLVHKKESLFLHQDFSYNLDLMILLIQEIIMEGTEISMCITKMLVIKILIIVNYCENGFPLWVKKHP